MVMFKAATGGLNRSKRPERGERRAGSPLEAVQTVLERPGRRGQACGRTGRTGRAIDRLQLLVGLGFFQGVRPECGFDGEILTLDNDTYLRAVGQKRSRTTVHSPFTTLKLALLCN